MAFNTLLQLETALQQAGLRGYARTSQEWSVSTKADFTNRISLYSPPVR